GNVTAVVDDTDVPLDDGNACTSEVCTAGVGSHPVKPQGTACSQNGGVLCDGQATPACTQTFTLFHVGTGSPALGGTGTAAFLETYYPIAASTAISTVTLPTAASGSNQPLTLTGNSTTEGGLSRSTDGHYLVIPGYAVAPGGTTTGSGTTRVVGRVDALGSV